MFDRSRRISVIKIEDTLKIQVTRDFFFFFRPELQEIEEEIFCSENTSFSSESS